MARQLTPLGVVVVSIFKWICIPLLVAVIGYTLIAPRIGSETAKPDQPKQPKPHLSAQGKKFQSVREGEH